ncbi:hypothetical protein HanXRQr2_Chr08g0334781 [Helianthus annuus]|uniref:Uncharacterized protein n=1 Tax=Helianthus annuus TaxID=4232 RepID=A0A9K3IE61_HELAN|nr:hypothetical protein HanXRQr2_Chr08g0334781 [Helianthus annuus]
MFEFVISRQFGFPNNMWNDKTDITGVEIDKLVENIMCRFFFFFLFLRLCLIIKARTRE